MLSKRSHIHFIGIGGIGMSGLATVLRAQNYTISGCDTNITQQTVYDLKKLGCSIFEGNNSAQCHDHTITAVVYSSAIAHNSLEITNAQRNGVKVMHRSELLALLMAEKCSIAVAGSHGKTTTSSLLTSIIIHAQRDPSFIIGGYIQALHTNAHLGKGNILIAEADESDTSLTQLSAYAAIVTNIDYEHVDVYKDMAELQATFLKFLTALPLDGFCVLCLDSEALAQLVCHIKTKVITYGLNIKASLQPYNIILAPDYALFNVRIEGKDYDQMPIALPLAGLHNILNALAAIGVALQLGISLEICKQALEIFGGVERRFSYRGLFNKAELFDDYGHHPQEIKNTLLVAQARSRAKLHIVFQPHRYSRTKVLWNDFLQVFLQSSITTLIVTDIYGAGEIAIEHITSIAFIEQLKAYNPTFAVHYCPCEPTFNTLKILLNECTQEHDLILLQGAGNLYTFINNI